MVSSKLQTAKVPTTSSGRRRMYLSASFSGQEVAVDYPIVIFINAADLKILETNGFKGVFALGENSITMAQTTGLAATARNKLKRYKDPKRKEKLAKVINHIMSTFGAGYVKRVGGYLK